MCNNEYQMLVDEIVLDKAYYRMRAETLLPDVPHGMTNVLNMANAMRDSLAYDLCLTVLRDTVALTPSSWWQHFKKDCLPKWALRRWPVTYIEREVVVKVDPYLDCQGPVVRIRQIAS